MTLTLQGYLHNYLGSPVANATANAYAHIDGTPSIVVATTTTDANGKFVLSGMAPAQYDVLLTDGSNEYWWKGLTQTTMGDMFVNSLTVDPTSTAIGSVPVLLKTVTPVVGVDTAIAFSGFPTAGYSSLRIILTARLHSSAGNDVLNAQFNGDTGANYDYHEHLTFGGAGSDIDASLNNINFFRIGWLPSSANTAGSAATYVIDLPMHAGTSLFKSVLAKGSSQLGGTNGMSTEDTVGVWRSTAAITSISMAVSVLSDKSFATGTVAALYGIP